MTLIVRSSEDIGLKANSLPVPMGWIVDMMEKNFDFDAMVLGWQGPTPPGPANSKNIVLSSGQNHACFSLQEQPSSDWEMRADTLMHQIDASSDQAERHRLFAEVQRIWSEYLPEINLAVSLEAVASKNN